MPAISRKMASRPCMTHPPLTSKITRLSLGVLFGGQNIFVNDPSVLFFSVHRWSNGKFYPGGHAGAPTTVGEGAGAGYSVNIGWNQRRMGDAEYLLAFSQVPMSMTRP